ncbi:MAG: malto-oligosyltrehalose trehalohydrolase [Myxococcales bacterium]|nr:malto-oligosyltrehalose trehalohydrolase [Myxococcales bacterium]
MTSRVRVWAPRASRIDVIRGSDPTPAAAERGGWWAGPVLAPGEDYAIAIDGGPPRPDPRSRWQPHGVHGASRWVDAGGLSPAPLACHIPLRDAVIYELHVGTFSRAGTFAGAIEHLDHLVELGITHVELLPVAQFPGTHGWGYDGVDLWAAHAGYGGPAGLHELIGACHARGLAVLIDVVHNHFGPEGAYVDELGPYHTPEHMTPWGPAINLDRDGSAEVRALLIESALAWLRDYGADGLRLDALHALRDDGELHFVAELTDAVRELERELQRPLILIGEWDEHDPKAVRSRGAGGWGLDAHWNDDFHHAVHALVTGEHGGFYQDFAAPDTLAKVLTRGYALDGGHSPFRGKPHGTPFGDLPRDRLVAYIQSHDQVGNRARGDRLGQLAGPERAKVAAALMLTSPFVPMLFQGEEWAASTPFLYFTDLGSEALRTAVREGRKREHGLTGWDDACPDPTEPGAREASVLRWEERDRGDHAEMLAWYRSLIALRREHAALRDAAPDSISVRTRGAALEVTRGPFHILASLDERPLPIEGDVVLASPACVIVRR